MRVKITEPTETDLEQGYLFYEQQGTPAEKKGSGNCEAGCYVPTSRQCKKFSVRTFFPLSLTYYFNKRPRGKPSRIGSTFASLKRGIYVTLCLNLTSPQAAGY